MLYKMPQIVEFVYFQQASPIDWVLSTQDKADRRTIFHKKNLRYATEQDAVMFSKPNRITTDPTLAISRAVAGANVGIFSLTTNTDAVADI
jgi:hypothetical protein